MIYASEARANEIADELNRELGHPPAQAELTIHGWTVIRKYRSVCTCAAATFPHKHNVSDTRVFPV